MGAGRIVAANLIRRGKSGLHRAGRWATPRGSDPRKAQQKANRRLTVARVKRWCKRPPDTGVIPYAGHTPSGARPNREGTGPVIPSG